MVNAVWFYSSNPRYPINQTHRESEDFEPTGLQDLQSYPLGWHSLSFATFSSC